MVCLDHETGHIFAYSSNVCPNSQNEEYAERLKMESDFSLSTIGPGVWGGGGGGGGEGSYVKVTGMLANSLKPKLQVLV